jgi:NAD-dependent DNA ligase
MPIEHPDHESYRRFSTPQRVDKAIQTLRGLLTGVTIDGKLNAAEVAEVLNWCDDNKKLVGKSPFNELKQKLDEIIADGVITQDEQQDLLWVCNNLSQGSEFYDILTHDIQRLHGIMHGILADGHISEDEAARLHEWVDENSQLRGSYPYDELDSLLTAVLKDGTIDDEEQAILGAFFEDFIGYSFAKRVQSEAERVSRRLPKDFTLPGICAMCPDVEFEGRVFSFTGSSLKGTRSELVNEITKRGGAFSPNVTLQTQYLVIGAAGNPCWAFSCYGRKVEKAVEYRKNGTPITIVHETDFWDAVADGAA